MGRPERPVDPAAGPYQAFAQELRQLRAASGRPSYRELARRAHYSAATLARAADGTGLPSLAVTLAFVQACGGDSAEWRQRWHAAAVAQQSGLRQAAPLADAGPGTASEPAAPGGHDADGRRHRDETEAGAAPAPERTAARHTIVLLRRRWPVLVAVVLVAALGAAVGYAAGGPPHPVHAAPFGSVVVVGPGAGCCTARSGNWTLVGHGGYPHYTGPIVATLDTNASITWTLRDPGGTWGRHGFRVRVWIPNAGAGAWVRYAVTTAAGTVGRTWTFEVAQEPRQGWYSLPATFLAPAGWRGSVTIRQTFLRSYAGPAADPHCPHGICGEMAAGQVQLTELHPR